jgi:hypothetical protein
MLRIENINKFVSGLSDTELKSFLKKIKKQAEAYKRTSDIMDHNTQEEYALREHLYIFNRTKYELALRKEKIRKQAINV